MWNIPTKENKVFLTFDDGPQPQASTFVLDTLKKYNVKATFFVVGANVEKYPKIFERMKNEGHSIGNHSFTHLKGWNTSTNDYVNDIAKCQELVQSPIFRPPYGRISPSQIKILKKNYHIIMWNKLGRDYQTGISPNDVIKHCTSKLKSGDVIVLHDSQKTLEVLKKSLPTIIESIQSQGFSLEKITYQV